MSDHVRFHVDLSPSDNTILLRLAGELTSQKGVRVTKLEAMRLAIRRYFVDLTSANAVPERTIEYEDTP